MQRFEFTEHTVQTVKSRLPRSFPTIEAVLEAVHTETTLKRRTAKLGYIF